MVRRTMEEIAISKFKATCLAVPERVRETGLSVRVTRRGEVVAEIQPPRPKAEDRSRLLGRLRGKGNIIGDIVSPATDPVDW